MDIGRAIARRRYLLVWWMRKRHLITETIRSRESQRLIAYGERHPKKPSVPLRTRWIWMRSSSWERHPRKPPEEAIMPDLQHDLAALDSEYARVEAQLTAQQADQQDQLQALADQFTAENTPLAREMVMLSGAMRHVQGQIARDEQAERDPSNGHDQPDGDLSLLQRITHKQEADRFAAAIPEQDAEPSANASLRDHFRTLQRDMISAAIPDNDPD